MQPNLETDPQVRELTTQTNSIVTRAASLKVINQEGYASAGADLKTIKGAMKRLDEIRDGMVRPLNTSLKAIRDFFRTPEQRLQAAETQIKRAMVAYDNEQDRLRRAEQAKVEEAARKERERLAARAVAAQASGKVEKAHELEQRAAAVVAPVIQREPPKVAGVATREVPKFEITDASLLPREYLVADEQKIRRVVSALKMDTNIPGVKVWMDKQIAAGVA